MRLIMIVGGKVRLRSKRLADAVNDYAWQTDEELTQLDAAPLLTMTFFEYLSTYAGELRHPDSNRHMFAVETLEGRHIGNCVYYNVSEVRKEVELGIMIGDQEYWDNGYGTDAVATLVDCIFRQTNLDRIYLKTLEWNGRAQKCFRNCGFTPYGRLVRNGYNFVLMEVYRNQWEEQCQRKLDSGVKVSDELE